MAIQQLSQTEAELLVPTYARFPACFTHGEGPYLYDQDGERYLDFAAGIAVTALGHSHPALVEAIRDQAGRLIHHSNLYYSRPQLELAERLIRHSFADRAFFSNSGSEANEAALKFARKWGQVTGGVEKSGLVAFEGGFHGRTSGALSLTHKPQYRAPFEPLLPGVAFAPFNDLPAAEALIDQSTCAVFVEPVQGEGGVHPGTSEFLRGLRASCDQNGALLIFDEIQCSLGRTGWLWAHQAYGVEPDLMTLAKPLAGGLPIGVTLTRREVAEAMQPGDHGSTFGGGPLICRAATVVFDQINRPELLAQVKANGEALARGLRELDSPAILQVRGMGLMLGVELDRPARPLIEAALQRGLIVINAGEKVLRLLPPLTISPDEVEAALGILDACLREGPWDS